jgi:hypothetical protein
MPVLYRLSTIAALAAGLLLATASARAELVDIVWSPSGQMAHRFEVQPGKFAELCGKLAKGAAVRWRYESSGPLNFNIHYHEGKTVHYPVKQEATARAEGTLAAALDQDYCWMWSNKGTTPLPLQVQLAR